MTLCQENPMNCLRMPLSALALVSTISLAAAGDIATLAENAEKLMAEGKYEEATKALEAAQDALWKQSPLMFRRALFTAGEPVGYGVYDLRETNVFKRSEPLIIYSEPMGYSYGRDGSLYVIELELDFIIRNPDGQEVAAQKNFGVLKLSSRFPNKEFMAKVTYDFSGLPPGDYQVTTVAHDKASSKSADFTLPFTLTD
jgi:hypothetical protein